MNSLLCDINHFFFSKIKTKQNKTNKQTGQATIFSQYSITSLMMVSGADFKKTSLEL